MPISDDARALLEQPIFASLATIGPDGHPQVTVVWLDVDRDKVVFNTAAGRAKHRNMEADPRVTLDAGPLAGRVLTIARADLAAWLKTRADLVEAAPAAPTPAAPVAPLAPATPAPGTTKPAAP